MDGHFVPNLTIGPDVIKSIRGYTKKTFDVHLMIDPVKKFLKDYVDAGSDIITIHHEISDNVFECIDYIKKNGKKVGISIKPKTSPDILKKYINKIDLILIMTVEPGFGGQKFMVDQIEKIKSVKNIIGDKNIEIEVDGGINLNNVNDVKKAGANVLVSGSTIFKNSDYKTIIEKLRST
jgi:ribulose-phosphate 3-epimerase